MNTTSRRYVRRMLEVGIPEPVADDIVTLLQDISARKSALRHQAARGGWLDSEDYIQAIGGISNVRQIVREKYGDVIFERYLFATYEPNCLVVVGIGRAGAAEGVDVQPGDIIFRVGESRCFSADELPALISESEEGGSIPVTIRRGTGFLPQNIPTRLLAELQFSPGYASF